MDNKFENDDPGTTIKTWRSLLCQKAWVYPTTYGNWITFKEDGTGELHCGVSPSIFIAAELLWKPVDENSATVLQQPVDQEITVDIELTLSKRRPDKHETTLPGINEENLTAAAFRPKIYKLQIATGQFPAAKWFCFSSPRDFAGEGSTAEEIEACGCHDLRIVFDKSPYPPLEEWAEQKNSVDKAIRLLKFWEFRDFYQDSPELMAANRLCMDAIRDDRSEEKRLRLRKKGMDLTTHNSTL